MFASKHCKGAVSSQEGFKVRCTKETYWEKDS